MWLTSSFVTGSVVVAFGRRGNKRTSTQPPTKKRSKAAVLLQTMAVHHNAGSSTCVVEPVELSDVSHYLDKPQQAKVAEPRSSLRIDDTKGMQSDDPVEKLPSPTTQAAEKLERWYAPRTNLWRTFAAFWSFVVMGSNDAAYGVCSRPSVVESMQMLTLRCRL